MFNALNKLLGLILLAWFAFPLEAAEIPPLTHQLIPVKGSQPAPSLRLTDMDDEIRDLEQLRGRVVVINFWATWCPPCRREMPSLERLHQQTKDRGVVVLAVNIGEDVDTVFPFFGQLDPAPGFPILFDTKGESLKAWGVRGLPTTYVVGPDGKLAYKAVGGREFDHPDLVSQLLELASP